MKQFSCIILLISSISLLATEETPQSESTGQAKFRKKRNSFRLKTGHYPKNQQADTPEHNGYYYSTTYCNYKENDDGSITISSHIKRHERITLAYKYAVTLSKKDLAQVEELHRCYSNPQNDARQCTLVAGKTLATMYDQINLLIPTFFEFLNHLRNEQAQTQQ